MTIDEIRDKLDIYKMKVLFYEEEGLISPERDEKGERIFSEEDFIQLKRIIIFRKLGLSIHEIKEIFEDRLSLVDAMKQNIEYLEQNGALLDGALDVCKNILNYGVTYQTFDENHYWDLIQTKENNEQLFDNANKIYEGQYGIKWVRDVLVFILIYGAVKGLKAQFISKTDNFIEGFLDGLFVPVFAIIVLAPMIILTIKYQNHKVTEESTSPKHSRFITFIKVILAILYLPALFIGLPMVEESLVLKSIWRIDAGVVINNLTYIYYVAGVSLFVILLWLCSKNSIMLNFSTGKKTPMRLHIPKVERKKAIGCSVLTFCASIVICMSWYECFTEDGIRIQHFFSAKEYSWEDVNYYSLAADSDGTIDYTVVMKDGTEVEFYGDVMLSNLPEEKYPDDIDDFGKYLAVTFTEMEIELRVDDWEKLYEELEYDYWKDYVKDIRKIVEGR